MFDDAVSRLEHALDLAALGTLGKPEGENIVLIYSNHLMESFVHLCTE